MQLILDISIKHGNVNVTMSGMNCVESILSSVTGKLMENHNDKNKKIFNMLLTIFGKLLSKSIQSGNQNNMLTVNNNKYLYQFVHLDNYQVLLMNMQNLIH